jgi:thiamine biosynthesis lipoprotein ApbE
VTAEIIAKTALILGPVVGMEFIQNQSGIDGILVLNDGRLLISSNSREVTNVH